MWFVKRPTETSRSDPEICVDLGFEYLRPQIGPDQDGFFEFYQKHIQQNPREHLKWVGGCNGRNWFYSPIFEATIRMLYLVIGFADDIHSDQLRHFLGDNHKRPLLADWIKGSSSKLVKGDHE